MKSDACMCVNVCVRVRVRVHVHVRVRVCHWLHHNKAKQYKVIKLDQRPPVNP